MTVSELKKILDRVADPDRTIVLVNKMPANRFYRVQSVTESTSEDEAGVFPTFVVEIDAP